jgi:hypothetical protein
MTLPVSGPISLGAVAAELGIALPLSLGDARVRALAGKPSGPISLGDLRGKSAGGPMSVTAQDGYGAADTRLGAGAVSCSPGVDIVGGNGTKTCTWVVLSNPKNCVVTLGTGPSVTVKYNYQQNANGTAVVSLRCTVVDQIGQQQTVDVTAYLEWTTAL